MSQYRCCFPVLKGRAKVLEKTCLTFESIKILFSTGFRNETKQPVLVLKQTLERYSILDTEYNLKEVTCKPNVLLSFLIKYIRVQCLFVFILNTGSKR